MAVLCMLYFVVFGTALAAATALCEQALPARTSRRWIWLAAIVLSIAIPILTSIYRSSAEIAVLGHRFVSLPSTARPLDAWYEGLHHAWLYCHSPTAVFFMQTGWAVTGLLFLWSLANAWRVSRLTARSRMREQLVDDVPVVVTESLGPATSGVWRPRVLVPRWVLALPAAERRYVIRHEQEHRGAHDVGVLAFAGILVCLMPWNLILWWQLRRLRLAVEQDCDRRVVAALGDAPAYAEVLLRVAEASSRGRRLQPGLTGGLGMLERRFRALVAPRSQLAARRWLALAVSFALLATLFSAPHPLPAESASHSGKTTAHNAH